MYLLRRERVKMLRMEKNVVAARTIFGRGASSLGVLMPLWRHTRSLHGAQGHQSPSTTTISTSDHSIAAACAKTLPPLSLLPFSILLRSYLITSISASPILLRPSMRILSTLANSSSPFLSPDRNPVLHWSLKKTFYKQYCAGETSAEVRRTVEGLKRIGYRGVILGYAKEVVLRNGEAEGEMGEGREELERWRRGTMETVRLTERGDHVALKYVGLFREFERMCGEGRR